MGPEPPHRYLPGALCALLLTSALAPHGALADGAPRLIAGDRGPLNGVIGLPDGWTRAGGPLAELSWQIANNAMVQASGSEQLLLDGETHVVTLRLQHPLHPRLRVGLALPWIAHSGGFLDRAIDAWHDALGLSEGIRPELPANALNYAYSGAGSIDLRRSTSGFGDLRTSGALLLTPPGSTRPVMELTADIDWPTGDASRLTGSGGTDFAAGLRIGQEASATGMRLASLGWTLQAGIAWPGHVDTPLPPAAGQVRYYDAALAWAATRNLDLLLQLNGHSGAFQSRLRMLGGEALQLGAGAAWRLGGRYALRAGFFEDIRADTVPDVTFEIALTVR